MIVLATWDSELSTKTDQRMLLFGKMHKLINVYCR